MKITVEKIEDLEKMPLGEVKIINRWGGLSTFLHRKNYQFSNWDFFSIRAFYIDNKQEKKL